jgi:hypothetical protein
MRHCQTCFSTEEVKACGNCKTVYFCGHEHLDPHLKQCLMTYKNINLINSDVLNKTISNILLQKKQGVRTLSKIIQKA